MFKLTPQLSWTACIDDKSRAEGIQKELELEIVTRDGWGLPEPKNTKIPPLETAVTSVYVKGMRAAPCYNLKKCASNLINCYYYHMNIQMQEDIRFNFIIAEDGRVYEGRGWHTQPSLPRVYSSNNASSIYIGFAGDYRSGRVPVILTDIAANLVEYGIANNYVDKMFLYHDIITFTYHKQYTQNKTIYE